MRVFFAALLCLILVCTFIAGTLYAVAQQGRKKLSKLLGRKS